MKNATRLSTSINIGQFFFFFVALKAALKIISMNPDIDKIK